MLHVVCLTYVCSMDGICRAMLASSAAFAVMRCLSVCLSVTFVSCVKTNEHIIKTFAPSDSHTILAFPCQTA